MKIINKSKNLNCKQGMLLAVLLSTIIMFNELQACTGIRLTAGDSTVVYGRTMEWGAFDLNSRITVIPRDYAFTGLTPEGVNGKKWTAKYGFVGLDMMGEMFIAEVPLPSTPVMIK